MSGHSKWATIKHKKGAADKARAKLFAKLIRQVEVAAREGGSDLDANATLRTMYQKARDSSVPLDTIERAIKRGSGELEGVRYEAVTYEGYAPHGVAVLVDVLTDNRNRTGADVRGVLKKWGGSIAEPGAVAAASGARSSFTISVQTSSEPADRKDAIALGYLAQIAATTLPAVDRQYAEERRVLTSIDREQNIRESVAAAPRETTPPDHVHRN
jgi:YebC/PmpR family DNA-binding regulatory protein